MVSPQPSLIVGRTVHLSDRETITRYIVRCPICAEEFETERSHNLNERISNFAMCPDCRNSAGRREAIRAGKFPGIGFEVAFQRRGDRISLMGCQPGSDGVE